MAAKKLLNPLEDPPTASSSNDDEVETSSGEDEEQISDSSSSEEDKFKFPSTKTLKTPSAAAAPSSDSGSDSESEPEEKTIVTAMKSGKKRVSEATSSKEHAKRTKKVSGDDDDDVKPFQRVWSEEDEISLLQGMIDFKAEKGTDPYDDMNEFYDVAKECISFDVSKIQFGDKMRSLKNKYMVKDKKKGSFSKPHEKNCFELANCFWGSSGMDLDSANGKGKKLKPKDEEDKEVVFFGEDYEVSNLFEKSFLVRSIASLGMDEYLVKENWSKLPMETKKRIEKKLKLVEVEEFELMVQKIDIVKEVTSVIAEAN